MAKEMLVSVIVCTYNRSALLRSALESLENQTAAREAFEVVVVDNNSSDDTAEVAQEFVDRHSNLRVIHEPQQGLSHARNRGYKEAKGGYVAYIDDDVRVPADWLNEIIRFIERRPGVQAFGGPYIGYGPDPVPEWLPPDTRCFTLGDVERALRPGEWIHGCNMIFAKNTVEKYGGFNVNLGMTGDSIGYGEETDLLMKLRRDGVEIFYVPALQVKHLIDSERYLLRWHLNSYYADGKYSTALFQKELKPMRMLGALAQSIASSPAVFLKQKNAPFKRRLFYALRQVYFDWGSFAAMSLKKRIDS